MWSCPNTQTQALPMAASSVELASHEYTRCTTPVHTSQADTWSDLPASELAKQRSILGSDRLGAGAQDRERERQPRASN